MKASVFFVLILPISVSSIAQDTIWICNTGWPLPGIYYQDCLHLYQIDLEKDINFIAIDTTTEYQWQVGTTAKFEARPSSWNKSLVTDTANTYPDNFLSGFRITVVGNLYGHELDLNFTHLYDTDSGKDGGKIEIRDCTDKTWKNIVDYPGLYNSSNLYSQFDTVTALNNEPGFSGSSGGARQVCIVIITESRSRIDTIDLQFVFASDSVDNKKDGWIINDIELSSTYEGISVSEDPGFNIFPNPFSEAVEIQNLSYQLTRDLAVEILDIDGKSILSIDDYNGRKLNLKDLGPGLYFVKIIAGDRCFIKKIVKIE